MLKEYLQAVISRSQYKELEIFVQSLVISVSKKNISETKYSNGKVN